MSIPPREGLGGSNVCNFATMWRYYFQKPWAPNTEETQTFLPKPSGQLIANAMPG